MIEFVLWTHATKKLTVRFRPDKTPRIVFLIYSDEPVIAFENYNDAYQDFIKDIKPIWA